MFITTGARGGLGAVLCYRVRSVRLFVLGLGGPRFDVDGPVTSSVIDLSSRDNGGSICPKYELIDTSYNGWVAKIPIYC
jgi:hypothetical protein